MYKADVLYKFGSILIATYRVGGHVSIKPMVCKPHLSVSVCVCARGDTAPVSLTEHNVQFDSQQDNLNDLWRLLPLAVRLASWRQVVAALLPRLAFGQGRAVIKNSAFCWLPLNVCQHFLLHIVCHFGYRPLNDVCLSPCTALCPPGGDCGFEEGGQRSGPGLPLASPHRDRPAGHQNHPVLFKGKL